MDSAQVRRMWRNTESNFLWTIYSFLSLILRFTVLSFSTMPVAVRSRGSLLSLKSSGCALGESITAEMWYRSCMVLPVEQDASWMCGAPIWLLMPFPSCLRVVVVLPACAPLWGGIVQKGTSCLWYQHITAQTLWEHDLTWNTQIWTSWWIL